LVEHQVLDHRSELQVSEDSQDWVAYQEALVEQAPEVHSDRQLVEDSVVSQEDSAVSQVLVRRSAEVAHPLGSRVPG
jgi:hypothetical protein